MQPRTPQARCLALSLAVALAWAPADATASIRLDFPVGPAPATTPATPTTSDASPTGRKPAATAAFALAKDLIQQQRYDEAVEQLDLASDLEPTWSEPVRVRADVFATLADKYRPSEAHTASRAADLQRLLVLEPGVDTQARQQEIAELQQQSKRAGEVEARRRKLLTPAFLVIFSSAGLLIAGTLLYSMKPNDFLKATAWRYEHRDDAGLGMLIAGAILVPPAIVLGVLAARQSRRDSALRQFNTTTHRPRRDFSVAPQALRGGAGLGFALRF
ncbi:hypothetical protein [Nannocystis radixulma]|uniref:Tetratricopeptide repeat protein n=1 Tax=Nannocystis radixulma TaxID=2995305 RepID=A0ABT5B7F7_9BACT|nr:hypothetical protein [Nannocystis radixulma]MDC0669398.1 hypothetical protein [Nannocystis radixulma]